MSKRLNTCFSCANTACPTAIDDFVSKGSARRASCAHTHVHARGLEQNAVEGDGPAGGARARSDSRASGASACGTGKRRTQQLPHFPFANVRLLLPLVLLEHLDDAAASARQLGNVQQTRALAAATARPQCTNRSSIFVLDTWCTALVPHSPIMRRNPRNAFSGAGKRMGKARALFETSAPQRRHFRRLWSPERRRTESFAIVRSDC